MAQHQRFLVDDEAQVIPIGKGGKLVSITFAVTGNSVFTFHSGDTNGREIYKVDCAIAVPHDNLHLPFNGLFAKLVSGTTGELNVMVE